MTQVLVEDDTVALLGEAPRWHVGERQLYWVDIAASALHRYDPLTGKRDTRTFAEPVGCFAFVRSGGFVLGMREGFALLDDWASDPVPFGTPILRGLSDLRLNDGRTDSIGRFWAGSYDGQKTGRAALYRLSGEGTVDKVVGDMMTSNGAAFSPDGRTFYHADTPTHAIRQFPYDPETAQLGEGRIFHQFPAGRGRPDGGSVDAEGCYWSALYDGGRVVRLSPAGDILREIALPVSRPTMIAFGGDDLCTAFVTSARQGLSPEELLAQPLAGALFSFRVDVPGLPEVDFVLR